ncbi:predicted protein [Naegleria gruberi]|uniref:Predicted protein n=1 Tax=Naegleria gruberi TaxID=5762 RepID=D2VRV1_NAEGR|nr:uncharacterized protein NAEGRDRAFT_51763 [Naegleria gruberi]EFC40528.1 predicted protein [Naegleria gruberi]|eukprot:XP_002673272.1 predicted protein [Naegleria gruberi strain NEG-M]
MASFKNILPSTIDELQFINYLKIIKQDALLNETNMKQVSEQVDHLFRSILNHIDEEFEKEIISSSVEETKLFQYSVPKKVQGGGFMCSRVMDEKPFDLFEQVFVKFMENCEKRELARYVHLLYKLVNAIQQQVGCDWMGIYRNFEGCLYKMSYYGKYSRADFPIDEEHAKSSTNSFVALNRVVVTLDDVNSASDSGQPYYSCDVKVQSECCAPILDIQNGTTLGIIDAEAHNAHYFTLERRIFIVRACFLLGFILPNNH